MWASKLFQFAQKKNENAMLGRGLSYNGMMKANWDYDPIF